ncbi:MAG: uracil-DNA glycosylase family protein [Myxococcaceae bacterium]
MIGPVVHGPPVVSSLYLLGQAPGPHEGGLGRPFAWTAGKTLFHWFKTALGVDEALFRERVYMSAVARCFPGKAKGGGDRKPDPTEIARCRTFVQGEVEILQPKLIIPVGALAIAQVLGHEGPLAGVVGRSHRIEYFGAEREVIPLPHPSGASTWHRMEPGKTLLQKALRQLAQNEHVKKTFR